MPYLRGDCRPGDFGEPTIDKNGPDTKHEIQEKVRGRIWGRLLIPKNTIRSPASVLFPLTLRKKGGSRVSKLATLLLIFSLALSLHSFALAKDSSPGDPSTGAVVLDILLLRPLGFCGTILGASAFVISLPVSVPFKKTDEASKILVLEPYNYTFERPLGKI